MSTSGFIATAVAYVISALGLWIATRKSKVRYVRWQWRKPHWILLRLFLLAAAFHGLFALFGIHPAFGFVSVGLFSLVVLAGDFFGVLAVSVIGLGWMFYQWIFWLPSRRGLILRNPRPSPRSQRSELVGVEGVAVSDLRPIGLIRVRDAEHSARSIYGLIAKGERVIIMSVGDFEVFVQPTAGDGAFKSEKQ